MAVVAPSSDIVKSVFQVGRYGPESFDFSREKVTASVFESLQRLQVGCYTRRTANPDHEMHAGPVGS